MPDALFWEEGCSFFVRSPVPFTSTSSMHGMFTYHMKQLIFTCFSGDRYSNRKHKTTDQFEQLAGQYSWSELSAVVATCDGLKTELVN